MKRFIGQRHRLRAVKLLPAVSALAVLAACAQEFRPSFAHAAKLSAAWEEYREAGRGDCEAWLDTISLRADDGEHGFMDRRYSCDEHGPVLAYLGPSAERGGEGAETDVIVHLLPHGRILVQAPFAAHGAELVDLTDKKGAERMDQLVQSHCDLLREGKPWKYVSY